MPNPNEMTEETIKPGVRRLTVPAAKDRKQGGEREAIQALLKQVEPGPTRTLLTKVLVRLEMIEEE